MFDEVLIAPLHTTLQWLINLYKGVYEEKIWTLYSFLKSWRNSGNQCNVSVSKSGKKSIALKKSTSFREFREVHTYRSVKFCLYTSLVYLIFSLKKLKFIPYHLSPHNRKITVTLCIFQTLLVFVFHKVL